MKLYLILLLFLLVCLAKKRTKKDKDASRKLDYLSPSYEHHGICPSDFDKAYKYLCLPYKYVTYDKLFNPKFLEPALDQFNIWMQRNPYWQEQVEARVVEDNGIKRIGLFANKEFPKYMKAYIMNEFDNFGYTNTTKDDFIEEFWGKVEEHEKFPRIEWKTTQQELTFALLYHLYWSDFSMYQHIFRLFPPSPYTPLFTLTYYEIKLLEGDEAFNIYMNTYDDIMLGYQEFNKILHNSWTDEQIESFYKGFTDIPIDDYVYIQNIIKRYSLSLKWVDDYDKNITHWTGYIPFAAMFVKGQIEKSKIGFRSDVDKKNKISYYFLHIDEKINKDEELSIQFNYDRLHIESRKDDPTYWYFIMHGIVPDENEQDCIDIPLIDPSLGATYGVPHVACVSPHNAKLLMYQAVGNLMNMDQKDYDECNELVYNNQIKFFGPEDEKKFIYDVCIHPEWKKVDIWDQALEEIEEKLKLYKNKIKKTKKYLELRKKIQKSTLNAEMILKYLEARREMLRDVKYQVEALQLSPKKYKTKVSQLSEDDTDLPPEMQGKFKPRFPERYAERKKEKQYEMEEIQRKAKENEEKQKKEEQENQEGEESKQEKKDKKKKKKKDQKLKKIEKEKEEQKIQEEQQNIQKKESDQQEEQQEQKHEAEFQKKEEF